MFAALLGRKRGTPVKVSVTLRLQSLSPFPATAKFKRMLVHWQRGDKKSGVTKAVLGAEDPSQRVAGGKGSHLKFDFRTLEAIEFTATLYKEGGRFAKKTVTLDVCETVDVSARNPATVGKLVLDLAELARALDGRDNELRLPLSTSAAVSAVCQPFLTLCVSDGDDDDDDEQDHKLGRASAAQAVRAGAEAGAGAARRPASSDLGSGRTDGSTPPDSGDEAPPPRPTGGGRGAPQARPPPPAAKPAAAAAAKGGGAGRFDADGFLDEDDEDDDDGGGRGGGAGAKAAAARGSAGQTLASGGGAAGGGSSPSPRAAEEDADRAALFSRDPPALFAKRAPVAAAAAAGAGGGGGAGSARASASASAPSAAKPAPGRRVHPFSCTFSAMSPGEVATPRARAAFEASLGRLFARPLSAHPLLALRVRALRPGSLAADCEVEGPAEGPDWGAVAHGCAAVLRALPPRLSLVSDDDDDDDDGDRDADGGGGGHGGGANGGGGAHGGAHAKGGQPAPRGGGAAVAAAAAGAAADKAANGGGGGGGDDDDEYASTSDDEGGGGGAGAGGRAAAAPPPRPAAASARPAPAPAAPAPPPAPAAELPSSRRSGKGRGVTFEAAAPAPAPPPPAAADRAAAETELRRLRERSDAAARDADAAEAAAAAARAARKRDDDAAADAAARRAAAEADAAAAEAGAAAARAAREEEESRAAAATAARSAAEAEASLALAAASKAERKLARAKAKAEAAGGPGADAATQSDPMLDEATGGGGGDDDGAVQSLLCELVDCASVELATRTGPWDPFPPPGGPCGPHAPARALVHALRSAPPDRLPQLSRRACAGLAQGALCAGGCAAALLFWASNAAALRAALTLGAVWPADAAPPADAVHALVAAAGALEARCVEACAEACWEAGPAAAARTNPRPPARGRTADDALAQHWEAALQRADEAMLGPGRERVAADGGGGGDGGGDAPVAAARRRASAATPPPVLLPPAGAFAAVASAVLRRVVVRLDAALFNALLRSRQPAAAAAAGAAAALAPPPPAQWGDDPVSALGCVPVGPTGGYSPGSGPCCGLLAERLHAWAAQRGAAPPSQPPPLRLLGAACAVALAPKAGLGDSEMRSRCAPGVPGPLLARLLAAFSPDADAPSDAAPAALVEALAREGARKGRKAAAQAAAAAVAPAQPEPYAPPAPDDVGLAWLDEDGFPLDDDGLAAGAFPLAQIGVPDPAPHAQPDARFPALRKAWDV